MVDYMRLLRSADDPVYAEKPPGFKLNIAESTFTKLAQEIISQFPGSNSQTEIYTQDASFHGGIFIASQNHYALVRASNFGSFISVFDEDNCLAENTLQSLIQQFQKYHYVYIPADVLDAPYDGKNPGVSGFIDWRSRYFDYI